MNIRVIIDNYFYLYSIYILFHFTILKYFIFISYENTNNQNMNVELNLLKKPTSSYKKRLKVNIMA